MIALGHCWVDSNVILAMNLVERTMEMGYSSHCIHGLFTGMQALHTYVLMGFSTAEKKN
jgi:hypothetical protein